MKPPAAAAAESTMRIGCTSSTSPFLSTKPARLPTATTVPMVSKKSLMSRLHTNSSSTGCTITCAMASVPSGVTWNGAANAEKSGANEKSVTGGVTPIGMPMIVAATMEISRAPLRLTAVSTTATMMEMAATMAVGLVRSPSARNVDSSAAMNPPPCSPMKAMNKPMPMPMAHLRDTGMASMTALRKPQSTSSKMRMPSRNTTAMATRQSTPRPRHSE